MIQEARNIQKIVRNLYPLYLNHNDIDPSVGVVTTLLQHLILLKNSTLNDGVLCQYLDNIRNKLSDKMVDGIGLYLQHFNKNNIAVSSSNNIISGSNNSSNNSQAFVRRDQVSTTTSPTFTATITTASSTLTNNITQSSSQQQRGLIISLTDSNNSTHLVPPNTIDNRNSNNNNNNSSSNINIDITPANINRYHTTTNTSSETNSNGVTTSIVGRRAVTFDIDTNVRLSTITSTTNKPIDSTTKNTNDMNKSDGYSMNNNNNNNDKQPVESLDFNDILLL